MKEGGDALDLAGCLALFKSKAQRKGGGKNKKLGKCNILEWLSGRRDR